MILRLLPALALAAAILPAAAQTPAPALSPLGIRAQVTAPRAATISSEMAGRIDALPLRDGDVFSKGQALVRFHCAVQEGQLARARATLDKKRRLMQVHERLRKLGSVSVLELEISSAEVTEAAAEVEVMKAMVDRCSINAPYDGRVAGVMVDEHQFIGEGQPLLDIVDDRDLELEMIVPSRWLAWLKPSQRFPVEIDETGRTCEAEVTRLSGKVDPVSQSVKVYSRITAGRDGLLPGMSGRALIVPPKDAVAETPR